MPHSKHCCNFIINPPPRSKHTFVFTSFLRSHYLASLNSNENWSSWLTQIQVEACICIWEAVLTKLCEIKFFVLMLSLPSGLNVFICLVFMRSSFHVVSSSIKHYRAVGTFTRIYWGKGQDIDSVSYLSFSSELRPKALLVAQTSVLVEVSPSLFLVVCHLSPYLTVEGMFVESITVQGEEISVRKLKVTQWMMTRK